MSNQLDNINFKKSDPEGMLNRLNNFPEICREAWETAQTFTLPSYYIKAKKFLILGMGASGISGDIIEDLFLDQEIIIKTIHDYKIPGWVDKDTVVIACSYSGNTEETISGLLEAKEKGAKLIIITTGGKLKVLADKFSIPLYLFNFDSQPREAFPYLFLLLLSIFNKLGYFNVSNKDIEKTTEFLGQYRDKFKTETPFAINLAKALAARINGKVPLIYAGGHLKSVAKRFKSQFNENAKSFSFAEAFPELNHNAITGIEKPRSANFIIMLESNYNFERIIKQENITATILRKSNIELERVKFVPCDSPLSEILLMVMFGDFVSCYLGILNGVDLSNIKNVIFLKNELER